jgi:antitoxin (DNA-binding transcriptional repressor) of toxin-antitoxin stability system
MKKFPMSVTEASRNFADCVNRARYQNISFVLLKNGTPVAELTPSQEKLCSGSILAAAVAKARLTDQEAKAWRRDLQAARKALGSLKDKWQ